MSAGNDRALIKQKWMSLFKKALDADTWGQAIEASDIYTDLANLMERQQRDLHLDADDDSAVSKLQLSIKLRVSALTDLGMKKDTLSLEQIKSLSDIFSALFVTKVVGRFPIDLSKFQSELARKSPAYAANDDDDDESSSAVAFGSVANSASVSADHKDALDGVAQGTLLPPPNILSPNFNCLVIEIDRIGLKDAENYIDARLTVTVTDASGHPLEQAQETPISNRKKPQYVMFGNTIYIQTPLERLPEDFAIFFEFKHYKPDKKKISTRCFAFMEKEEITASSNMQLELYTKPTDFSRKNIRLHSVKPLYLHLKVSYRKT